VTSVERQRKQDANRWSPHNLLGALWVIGLALTILFYHLWWVTGKNVVHSNCLVLDARPKTSKCHHEGEEKKWKKNKSKCSYPSWEVEYRTTKHTKKSHIKGDESMDLYATYDSLQGYEVDNTYRCYYSTSKSSSVQWDDPGSHYLYLFSVCLFMCSILPCFCWLIGIPKLYGWCRRKYFGDEKAEPILLSSPKSYQPQQVRREGETPQRKPAQASALTGGWGMLNFMKPSQTTPQSRACPRCHFKVDGTFRFCPQCGCSTDAR